jgi:hypothetical protein
MKKIIILSLLLVTHLAFADQLPDSWINESETAEEANLPNLENTLDAHSDMTSNLVEKDAGKKGWEMFGYVTTFGVSASGKIGLLASSGSAAVEIYWRKKPPVTPVVTTLKTFTETPSAEIPADITEGDVAINEEANIDENVDEVVSFIKTKKEIKITEKLRTQIKKELLKLKNTTNAIEAMERSPNFNFNWYVKMIRLDLAIGAQGIVPTNITVGGELSIKIFWTRTEHKKQFFGSQAKLVDVSNPFAKTISNFMANLDNLDIASHTRVAAKQGFQLKMIRLGLGMNASGNIVVGTGTGTAVLNVMFAKKQTSKVAHFSNVVPTNMLVENADGSFIDLTSKKFVKGMNKSFKISEKIILKATKKLNRKYEPFMIWNMYSFTRGSSIGLVKVNGIGQLHLFFMK